MSTDSRRVIWSWALYDFANSPFTTLVVTFVYATYFTQAIAADPIHGTALWSRAVTATAVLVALLSPFLGALADRGGYRKVFVAGFTWLCVAAASTKTSLWMAGIAIGVFVGPNQSASRSLMARFVPPRLENEFFGFFAFSGKLTVFIGPFLLGVLTDVSGSQRIGVSAVPALFVTGLPLLMWVDEREGLETAARS